MKRAFVLAVLAALVVVGANAGVITLTFEGLQNLEPVNNFYNGGTGGLGSGPGTNFGISFTSDSLAIIEDDKGGTGNFADEPSADTILFFLTGAGDTMNVASGFDTGFSFFYSATSVGSVNVYSGLNGTGTLLQTLSLAANTNAGCPGEDDTYCVWTPIGVTFAGTAESVVFSGAANFIGFDNITLGSSTPTSTTPEPATPMTLSAIFAGLALLRRYRSRTV